MKGRAWRLMCLGAVCATWNQAPPVSRLPEGRGIAAPCPRDEGIKDHRSVLFADGFETVSGDRLTDGVLSEGDDRSHWNHAWYHAWGSCTVGRVSGSIRSGRQSLELSLNGPGSIGLSKYLRPGRERIFLRYYVRYADDFPGAHHVGGAVEARAPGVPHANPGVVANGSNKITVLLDHWSFEPGMTAPGPLVAYVYHMDQQHQWGEQFYPSGKIQPQENERRKLFGPTFVSRPDLVPERGRWYCYELMAEAGAPTTRGGRVAFWVDGRLRADFPNLRFRTTKDLKLNRVDLGLYESRQNGRKSVWFDDVVVATEYIGPMAVAPAP
jgi:hypothetical protein